MKHTLSYVQEFLTCSKLFRGLDAQRCMTAFTSGLLTNTIYAKHTHNLSQCTPPRWQKFAYAYAIRHSVTGPSNNRIYTFFHCLRRTFMGFCSNKNHIELYPLHIENYQPEKNYCTQAIICSQVVNSQYTMITIQYVYNMGTGQKIQVCL